MVVDDDYVFINGDPRVAEWPLMDTRNKSIFIVILYLAFVKVIGPKWMQNKKPFELRTSMLVYNALLVCLNSWIFIRLALYGWFNTYSWVCEPMDYSDNDIAVKILVTYYLLYLTKMVELLDTIFFILRKKQNQVTFLHVFHHGNVVIAMWYGCKYAGGGYTLLLPLMNTFVHIWMYIYYALAALGPQVQKYLWWKKHLTTLQLVQFIIGILYLGRIIIFNPEECRARPFVLYMCLAQPFVFFILFINFYINSYVKKTPNHGVPISNNLEKHNGNYKMDLKMH